MSHLEPGDQLLCAQMLYPLLEATHHMDTLARAGIDARAMRARLHDMLVHHDADTLSLDEAGGSEYDRLDKRRKVKEQRRDVGVLLRCYAKQSLTGLQVQEALRETPKEVLVDFMMQELAGWRPQKKQSQQTHA